MTTTYSVPDMSCQQCVDAITTEVSKVDGVTGVTVDLAAKTVVVVGGLESSIVSAIDDAGFDVADAP